MKADVLIAGAGGQLGRQLAARAAAAGLSTRPLARGDLDVTDRHAVLDAVEATAPRVVLNAAACTAVDRAESEPEAAHAVNRDGAAHLAEAAARLGAALVHVSTDYVFDGSKPGAWTEDDPTAPLGVYGASKLAGEEAVRARMAEHVILRTAWVYDRSGRNFLTTMLRVGAERECLRVVDDQHGTPTWAADLAGAMLTLARRFMDGAMPPDGTGTFHCTNAGSTTWCGFARAIFELAAPQLDRVPTVEAIATADYPTPARRPANSVLDCTRLERVHGLRLRGWEEALREALAAPAGQQQDRARA
ncbi:MAG TPA: dTDP-4-dehydrorhamnose reductase [Thermohalobaculum sp.]|nr:dTDP-4-dehydrorhamnose reductase [Thermohalobaculum sp.]